MLLVATGQSALILMKKGKIDGGGLYHFVGTVTNLSHGHINLVPTWIDIESPQFHNRPPPFIVFTGTQDFILTDSQIINLRAYLQRGATIWGDNANGKAGSSFDLAFRREMKRVLPDHEKKFEAVGPKDSLFFGFFNEAEFPALMTSVEHIDADDSVDIVYTPTHLFDSSEPKERIAMNILYRLTIRIDRDYKLQP